MPLCNALALRRRLAAAFAYLNHCFLQMSPASGLLGLGLTIGPLVRWLWRGRST